MLRYDMVLPDLWVGSHPRSSEDIGYLVKKERVNGVLNLQTAEDFERLDIDWDELRHTYSRKDVIVKRVPVVDFDAVDLRRKIPLAVAALHDLMTAGCRTYVHCSLGIERAPSVTIAYLASCCGYRLDKAWHYVKEQRESALPNFEAIWLAERDRAQTGSS